MLTIKNSTNILKVTKGAYESTYAPLGYVIVNDRKAETVKEAKFVDNKVDNENKEQKNFKDKNAKE